MLKDKLGRISERVWMWCKFIANRCAVCSLTLSSFSSFSLRFAAFTLNGVRVYHCFSSLSFNKSQKQKHKQPTGKTADYLLFPLIISLVRIKWKSYMPRSSAAVINQWVFRFIRNRLFDFNLEFGFQVHRRSFFWFGFWSWHLEWF